MTHEDFAPAQLSASRQLADVFVVLFEAEHNARELLTTLLGLHGALVVAAETTNEALDLLETGTADVFVSGAGLSDADRFELARALRDRSPERDVPALSLSESWSPSERSVALAAGYRECLAWPFSTTELVRVTERLVCEAADSARQTTI